MAASEPGRSFGIFQVECEGETLIITPRVDLGTLQYPLIETGSADIQQYLKDTSARNLVLDLQNTKYYGSAAIAFFITLWRHVKSHQGRMVLCNATNLEMEILKVIHFDTVWAVYPSRKEAVAAVNSGA
jgi:anti-anti-sigma factor